MVADAPAPQPDVSTQIWSSRVNGCSASRPTICREASNPAKKRGRGVMTYLDRFADLVVTRGLVWSFSTGNFDAVAIIVAEFEC